MDFGIQDINEAKQRLDGLVRKTHIMPFDFASKVLSANVRLKCENHQNTGSFKIRGAANKIVKLKDSVSKKDKFITASAGNHAQGVASAASKCGMKSKVIMPSAAPLAKIEATKDYGAEVELYGSCFDEAYDYACKQDGIFIHPYNDYDVIAGQGTIGLEILDDFADVDIVLAPAGGGGLLSGVACAIKNVNPKVKVIGVQSENANAIAESFAAKKKIVKNSAGTIADGIAVGNPGDKCVDIINKYVDDVISVKDEEIAASIMYLLERCKQVVEPAGAASVAALMNKQKMFKGKNICSILSGGNVDMNTLGNIIDQGLFSRFRKAEFILQVEDSSKRIEDIMSIFIDSGANILYFTFDKIPKRQDVALQRIYIACELRGEEHYKSIYSKLNSLGYKISNNFFEH